MRYEVEDCRSPTTGCCRSTRPTSRAGHRLELTKRAAQFTSSDGSSHLISLGEFAAMYLLVWSNACWTDAIPGATFVADDRRPR